MPRQRLALALTALCGSVLLLGSWQVESSSRVTSSALAQNTAQPASNAQPGNAQPDNAQPGNAQTPAKKKAQVNKKKQMGAGAFTAPVAAEKLDPSSDTRFNAELLETAEKGGVAVLSNGDSYDDFVSVAQTSDGTLYAAYSAYFDGHDQVRIHKQLASGKWSTRTYAPLVEPRADVWMPQLAVDAQDRVWLIWSEQTDRVPTKSGNWDLYARWNDGLKWGPLVRLTQDPRPDINPHVFQDPQRNIHVVWQAHPKDNGDIQYCSYDGKDWSAPLAVTSDAPSDWYPRGAVDDRGRVWITFDSYRNGDYDVFLTHLQDGQAGPVLPIAASPYYEAHASVACTPDGTVWVAYEQGGHNWGKDQGYIPKQKGQDIGTSLGSTRAVKVVAVREGKLFAAPNVNDVYADGLKKDGTAMAELARDGQGRLWLRYRHMVRNVAAAGGKGQRGWFEDVTYLTAKGWATPRQLAASAGRISVFSRILPAKDGSLVIGFAGDARTPQNYHRPIRDHALVTSLAAPTEPPGAPELEEAKTAMPPAVAVTFDPRKEADQVAAIRKHRIEIDGKPHQIVRGDLHRHTELSWDVGPGNDGCYLDFYRYMIDVAGMDFGGLTDHQGGGHYPYWWHLIEKSADLYYLPNRFLPLYTYERSAKFPDGHRNIIHATRGVPVFPFQIKLNVSGVFPGIGAGDLLENDTKLLYEYLRKSGGLCISHTSGTSTMGTDWRDNDPWAEPVVEIYQGARNSYEALGAPRVHDEKAPPDNAPGGFQTAGMVWKAYEKGYRLGTIASSDHGSTHISYALVVTPEFTRPAILDAIRKRHTYGATDNLIVEVWANGHFQGEEFTTPDRPSLQLKVTGTTPIQSVHLIRNNAYVYNAEPKQNQVSVQYVDMDPAPDLNQYYFRILQEDGQVAWTSPIWVHYQPQK